jgi:hypothetical protein
MRMPEAVSETSSEDPDQIVVIEEVGIAASERQSLDEFLNEKVAHFSHFI